MCQWPAKDLMSQSGGHSIQPQAEFLKQSLFSLRETQLFTQFSSQPFPVVYTDSMLSVVITVMLVCLYLFRVREEPTTTFSFLCGKWELSGTRISGHLRVKRATGHGAETMLRATELTRRSHSLPLLFPSPSPCQSALLIPDPQQGKYELHLLITHIQKYPSGFL